MSCLSSYLSLNPFHFRPGRWWRWIWMGIGGVVLLLFYYSTSRKRRASVHMARHGSWTKRHPSIPSPPPLWSASDSGMTVDLFCMESSCHNTCEWMSRFLFLGFQLLLNDIYWLHYIIILLFLLQILWVMWVRPFRPGQQTGQRIEARKQTRRRLSVTNCMSALSGCIAGLVSWVICYADRWDEDCVPLLVMLLSYLHLLFQTRIKGQEGRGRSLLIFNRTF